MERQSQSPPPPHSGGLVQRLVVPSNVKEWNQLLQGEEEESNNNNSNCFVDCYQQQEEEEEEEDNAPAANNDEDFDNNDGMNDNTKLLFSSKATTSSSRNSSWWYHHHGRCRRPLPASHILATNALQQAQQRKQQQQQERIQLGQQQQQSIQENDQNNDDKDDNNNDNNRPKKRKRNQGIIHNNNNNYQNKLKLLAEKNPFWNMPLLHQQQHMMIPAVTTTITTTTTVPATTHLLDNDEQQQQQNLSTTTTTTATSTIVIDDAGSSTLDHAAVAPAITTAAAAATTKATATLTYTKSSNNAKEFEKEEHYDEDDPNENHVEFYDDMEDPSYSILSRVHHDIYLYWMVHPSPTLSQQPHNRKHHTTTNHNNNHNNNTGIPAIGPQHRGPWKAFLNRIQSEQSRYGQILWEFIRQHQQHLCMGFVRKPCHNNNNNNSSGSSHPTGVAASITATTLSSPHDFSTIVSHHVQFYQQAWERSLSSSLPPPTTAAPPPPRAYLQQCCQRITIPLSILSNHNNHTQKNNHHHNNHPTFQSYQGTVNPLVLDSIQCHVVHIASPCFPTTMTTTTTKNDCHDHNDKHHHRHNITLEHILSMQDSSKDGSCLCQSIPLSAPKRETFLSSVQLLRYDDIGLDLCCQHNATIFTCEETLSTLLQLGQQEEPIQQQQQVYSENSRQQPRLYSPYSFCIPIVTISKSPSSPNQSNDIEENEEENGVTKKKEPKQLPVNTAASTKHHVIQCLDLPLPQPCSTPRECLTRGFQEGLYQQFAVGKGKSVNTTTTSTKPPETMPPPPPPQQQQTPIKYVYTLWSLAPSTMMAKSKSPMRMIVRSTERLFIRGNTPMHDSAATSIGNSQSRCSDEHLKAHNDDDDDDVASIAIRLLPSLEYFHGGVLSNKSSSNNHGDIDQDKSIETMTKKTKSVSFRPRPWEIPTSLERARWILVQKLVHSLGGRVYLARIDPATAHLLALEEKSIAHALACEIQQPPPHLQIKPQSVFESARMNFLFGPNVTRDPLVFWQALVDVLHAISTIRHGEHVICFPDRTVDPNDELKMTKKQKQQQNSTGTTSCTLSVHAATTASTVSNDETVSAAVWHVSDWFEQAHQVYMGEAAIRQSFRNWKWERSDRVPYTFPCP